MSITASGWRGRGRRDEAEPGVDLVALDALLVERGHARQQRRAREAGHAQRAQLAVLDLAD
ncbi:MAG UNVERIFIED_CONTAM: hypothetical protein LVT10_13780 [Anaerolineae bacterium]